MEATEVSAEDVAFELVATKVALQQLIWEVSGTTSHPAELNRWVYESPVPLPTDDDADAYVRLYNRAEVIESQMLRAIGNWCLAQAAKTDAE